MMILFSFVPAIQNSKLIVQIFFRALASLLKLYCLFNYFSALRHERQWPDTLVKVYIEDAIGERIWVDHPDCKGFVENICTAFDTKLPPSNIFFATGSKTSVGEENVPGRESPRPQGSGTGSRSGSGSATPTRPGTDDDSQVNGQGPFFVNVVGAAHTQI